MATETVRCPNPDCMNFGADIVIDVPETDVETWIGVICGPCQTLLLEGPAAP